MDVVLRAEDGTISERISEVLLLLSRAEALRNGRFGHEHVELDSLLTDIRKSLAWTRILPVSSKYRSLDL